MTMKCLIPICLAVAFITFSCSDSSTDVQPGKIFTDLTLLYNSHDDATYVSATFKLGSVNGQRVELPSNSRVIFNNDTLKYDDTFTYYAKRYQGKVNGGTFNYESSDGNFYRNTVALNSPIAYPGGFDTISKFSDYEFRWVGNRTVLNEKIELQIGLFSFYQTDENSNYLTMTKGTLQMIGSGPAQMFLKRIYTLKASEAPPAGGIVSAIYSPGYKYIFLK